MDVVYLDYQKAFDTVPHKRLLLKLQAYGFTGSTLDWIRNFLTGRTQHVSVNGVLSEERAVLSGVPQGSVLGPLLFLLFINDIVDDLETNLFLFADDSKLFKHIRTQADMAALQRDLVRLEDWSNRWLLRFHPDKCHVLSLGKFEALSKLSADARAPGKLLDQELFASPYSLCGFELDHVEEEKDLGVTIDEELTFSSHIDGKIAKANSFLGLIRRNFCYLDKSSMLRLFKAFVRPHLEYAQAVWSPHLPGVVNRIENVQIRALNLIPELRGLSYEEQLRSTKLPTLAYRRFRGDLIEVYKHLHSYDKAVITSSFACSARHPDKLAQTHRKSNLDQRLFYHRVQQSWNLLPASCRDLEITVDTFKNRVDSFFSRIGLPLLTDHRAGTPTHSEIKNLMDLNLLNSGGARSGR